MYSIYWHSMTLFFHLQCSVTCCDKICQQLKFMVNRLSSDQSDTHRSPIIFDMFWFVMWGEYVQGVEHIKIHDRTATALFRAWRPHNYRPWELVSKQWCGLSWGGRFHGRLGKVWDAAHDAINNCTSVHWHCKKWRAMEGSGWKERVHVNSARVTLGGGVEVQMSIYIGKCKEAKAEQYLCLLVK